MQAAGQGGSRSEQRRKLCKKNSLITLVFIIEINGVKTTVFDIASGFDQTCQEVGHALGLSHELGAWHIDDHGNYTNEYGCPYSVMSAARDLSFNRAPDNRLPGKLGPTNPQRAVGPYIPTAHLYINQYKATNPNGVFNHPDSVSYISTTYEHVAVTVRLYARDVAISAWPARRTVLAVLPPIVPGGDTHFLELRRKDTAYDGNIGNASIIILATNFFVGNSSVADPSTLRLRYIDSIDLEAAEGDFDYHSFSGRFVVRVSTYAPDFSWVNLSIRGGNAWQDFRLTFDEQINNLIPTSTGDWNRGLVAPCPLESKREFNYRIKAYTTFFILQAHSVGYEDPGYTWKLQGVPLNPGSGSLSLQVSCRDYSGHLMNAPTLHTVHCNYQLMSGRLELTILSPFADITLSVAVAVGETSPSVMKNYYPNRSVWGSVRADNLSIEWDKEYQAASQACWKRLRGFSNQIPEFEIPHHSPGDPDPSYFEKIGIREIIAVLTNSNPQAARAVAAVIADRASVSTEQVLGAVLRKSNIIQGD